MSDDRPEWCDYCQSYHVGGNAHLLPRESELAAPTLLAALRELYEVSAGLRFRCQMFARELKAFSDWEKHTAAMVKAESILKAANVSVSDRRESQPD